MVVLIIFFILIIKKNLTENDLVISLGDFGTPYWSAKRKVLKMI